MDILLVALIFVSLAVAVTASELTDTSAELAKLRRANNFLEAQTRRLLEESHRK